MSRMPIGYEIFSAQEIFWDVALDEPDHPVNGMAKSMLRLLTTCVLAVCCVPTLLLVADSPAYAAEQEFTSQSSVGFPVTIEQLVLPGSELEPVSWDDKTPVVLSIDSVFPHGTAFRYNLTYQALEPGEFDLADYLKRKDGSSTADLQALPVKIVSMLPPGQIQPQAVPFVSLPSLGGYRTIMTVALIIWVAVLLRILFSWRQRGTHVQTKTARHRTLAEHLRPLVTRAMQGDVSTAELAELERALEGYWRRRLKLEHLPPAAVIAELRAHAEAGPLISQLEAWLHKPRGNKDVDVAALLAPYQNLPVDALEVETPIGMEAGR